MAGNSAQRPRVRTSSVVESQIPGPLPSVWCAPGYRSPRPATPCAGSLQIQTVPKSAEDQKSAPSAGRPVSSLVAFWQLPERAPALDERSTPQTAEEIGAPPQQKKIPFQRPQTGPRPDLVVAPIACWMRNSFQQSCLTPVLQKMRTAAKIKCSFAGKACERVF